MRFVPKLALAVSLVASAGIASATTLSYDAVGDFSTSNGNANGNWTYGSGSIGSYSTGTGFTAYTDHGTSWQGSGYAYWEVSNDILPAVGYNTPGTMPGMGGLSTVSVPQTELWMHPGSSVNQDSIILFTVTTSGLYNLDAEFTGRAAPGQDTGNGVIVSIYINGILQGNDTLSGRNGDNYTYGNSIFLNAGDVISFDLNNNGSYGSDSTGFEAKLSTNLPTGATPEPASIALLGTGLLAVGATVRRKIRS